MQNAIAEGIHWVGVHFPTPPGAALNAYLIQDQEVALIDTTAPATAPAVLEKVKALADPREIRHIVLTHADLDHAGGLAAFLREAPQAQVHVSEFEAKSLPMWGVKASVHITGEGDRLSLGRHTLRFIQTPYICTPGHQLLFEESEGILFSGDLFAQIGPVEWTLFSEGDRSELLKKVQAMKLGVTDYPRQAIEKIRDLPVRIIASGHGQLLSDNVQRYMKELSGQA